MESMVAASTAAIAQETARSRIRAARISRRSGFDLFAVVQAANGFIGAEDHGGGYHWTEERAAPDLIHAGDGAKAAGVEFTLVR